MPRNVTENSGPAETTIRSKQPRATHINVELDGSTTKQNKSLLKQNKSLLKQNKSLLKQNIF